MMLIISLLLANLSIGTVAEKPEYSEYYKLAATECNENNSTCFLITEGWFRRVGRLTVQRLMELVDGDGFHHTSVELMLPTNFESYTESYAIKKTIIRNLPINKETVTTDSYKVMIAGGFLAESLSLENPHNHHQNLLIIGLGGGVIANFFSSTKFDKMKINTTTVELDPFVSAVAKKWFGYEENARTHTIIDDGIDYVKKVKAEGRKFRTVILDACYNKKENSLYCPVEGFLEEETIRIMADILEDGVKNWEDRKLYNRRLFILLKDRSIYFRRQSLFLGSLIVNKVLRDNSNYLRHKVLNKFTPHFTSCNVLRAGSSRILVCVKNRTRIFKSTEPQFLENLNKVDKTFGFMLTRLLK